MPAVSVIIPVYNVEKYLGECLDSVLGQTLKDIEVICVDDGSSDGSAAILAKYAVKESRVKVLVSGHGGAGAARNRGLAEARGEYLFFCDADDWIDRNALGALHASAVLANADIAMTGIRYFDVASGRDFRTWRVGGRIPLPRQPFGPSDMGRDLFTALRPQMGGKLFRRAFIDSLGIVFQEQPRVNDLAFVAVAIAMAERIIADGEARYHYRKNHGGNLSSGINRMPEMSSLAWLKVKANLETAGVFERFRPAFAYAASHSLYEVVVSMQDAAAMEQFFRKAQVELMPALGLERGLAAEVAYPFFDSDSPLPILINSLAAARQRYYKQQARDIALRAHPFRSLFRALWRRFT